MTPDELLAHERTLRKEQYGQLRSAAEDSGQPALAEHWADKVTDLEQQITGLP